MAIRFALGRQPDDTRKPRVKLHRLRGASIQIPEWADWITDAGPYPMLLNDKIGCCTAAGAGHAAQAVNFFGQGYRAPVTDQEVLAMYSAISGYDPRTGRGDVGATLIDALKYWRKTGIGGNTIAAYAQIDPNDIDLVRACIAIFGRVYTGMWFPSSAMDQFDAGQTWNVVSRSRNEGGHCVEIGAYDLNTFGCTTWGKKQLMTIDFYQRYFDEVWVPIDLDWLTAAGTSPSGLDIATLNADFEALTGEAGPFPGITPAPPVDPNPPVPPPAGDADQALVAAFGTWRAARGV